MWISNDFMVSLKDVLGEIANNDKNISFSKLNQFELNPKYNSIISILKELESNKKQKDDDNNQIISDISYKIDLLTSGEFSKEIDSNLNKNKIYKSINRLSEKLITLVNDSNLMNQSARNGNLDIKIDNNNYQGDFKKIANGINETIGFTIGVLRDISFNLDKLSNGNFESKMTMNYQGDYLILKQAFNGLGNLLNFLIDDSNKITKAVRNNELDERIDEKKYTNDFQTIVANINETIKESEKQLWIQNGIVKLNKDILDIDNLDKKLSYAISYLSRYTDSAIGAIYLYDKNNKELKLRSSYAFIERENISNHYKLGEGIIGQVALELQPIMLKNIKREEQLISTGTTETAPLNTYTYPLIYQNELVGVIEIATTVAFDKYKIDFFNKTVESLSGTIFSAVQIDVTNRLLKETQEQAAEMEVQANQLSNQNFELEEQKKELETQTQELEESQRNLELRNQALNTSQQEINKRSEELSESNRYKSEFLANMSHELRTPLNSINILSKLLENNKAKTLTDKQIEQAGIINKAGNDLLQLINDILDLSKIEAKMMSLNLSKFNPKILVEDLHQSFKPVTDNKMINLTIKIDKNVSTIIFSDTEKIKQIMKNFISNAIKFTDTNGNIIIGLEASNNKKLPINLYIKDDGIGIPKDKINSIFNAFQQVDGSTSRKFGGTGLGLSISKELTDLLTGRINVESEENNGSTFNLLLPLEVNLDNVDKNLIDIIEENEEEDIENNQNVILEDRFNNIEPRIQKSKSNKLLLIIEDDEVFANILKDEANDLGFDVLMEDNGVKGLETAKEYLPSAIILDMGLPILDGWGVLKELKNNPKTRHIPVKIISASEPNIASKSMGAVDYLQKPISPDELHNSIKSLMKIDNNKTKSLLIVEDDRILSDSLIELFDNKDLNITATTDAKSTIEEIKKKVFDCAIMDIGLPDMSGFKLLEMVKRQSCNLPIVVYSGREFTRDELQSLREYSETVVLKTAESEKRLLEETTLFLHRAEEQLSYKQQNILKATVDENFDVLTDKKILIVDDDVRNVFALTSLLEDTIDVQIGIAYNGQEALDILKDDIKFDIILMDIMMPILDGYETMKKIRVNDLIKHIPIIALTAKAQKDDRKKCIDAGANDYIIKPIDHKQLLQLMKIWIEK